MTQTDRSHDLLILRSLRAAVRRRPPADTVEVDVDAADFDWTVPHRFAPAELGRLDRFAAGAARLMLDRLEAALGARPDLEPVAPAERYGHHAREADPKVHRLALAAGGRPAGLVQVRAKTALAWTDRLLGGSGEAPDEARPLSPLEATLLVDVAAAAVGGLSDLLTEAGGPALDAPAAVLPPDTEPPFGDADALVRLALRPASGEAEPVLAVYLLEDLLRPVARDRAAPSEAAGDVPAAMRDHLRAAPVRAEARVGTTTLAVRELIALEPGDVLLLDAKLDDPVPLAVEGATVHRGEVVACDGRHGLLVQDARAHPRVRTADDQASRAPEPPEGTNR